ncbi:MAG: oligosaccharide flippase family protein [Dysgonamonadaceae bacterium]|jgi:O-antigen/teichoic acid export membrane protein|nr:oligosaccharide flippase family protein [Dysgonamonadaceae bacterium]
MNDWKKIKQIYASEFFKYSVALLSSNAISQLIGILAYPFITRIYAPDVFGEFNWLLSIAGVLSLFSTGKYELAIVLTKSKKESIALFQLCIILNLLVFSLSFFIVSVWKPEIASWFNLKNLFSLILFIPFIILLTGIGQTLNYFFIRQKQYYTVSAYNIIQSITGSVLKCVLGIKGFFQTGLLWGTSLGQFTAIFVCVITGKSQMKGLVKINTSQIIQVAKVYSNFPKFELPYVLLNTFASNLPVLLLSFHFEMEAVGLFSLAVTIGFRPINLFTNSVYQVLFRRGSERIQNKGNLKDECFLFCKMCLFFILPFFILMLFVPDELFGTLFGQRWEGVGFYLKLLLPGLFFNIMVASLSFIPDIFFKQKTAMKIEIGYVALKIIALSFGIYCRNFDVAIITYCCVVVLMLIIKLIWYFRLIKEYELSKN